MPPGGSRGVLAVLAVGFLLASSAGAADQQPPFVERPEAELLLLAVRLNQETISDSLPAFPLEKNLIIPLGELCRLLDFGIEVRVVDGSADGFFISPDRRFHLDSRTTTVTIAGKQSSYDRSKVEVHQDDIYVSTDLLSRWFPIDINVDLYTALVTIRPREPLPMQTRREREKMVQKSLASLGYGGPKYPVIPNPYRLFDGPFIDQTFQVIYGHQRGEKSQRSFQYSTLATGDLLGLETTAYLFGDDQEPISDFRMGMGRRDPDSRLLGPMRAREFGIGEVFHPGLDLIALPASGPGLLVSNYPLQQQNQFDTHTFIGNLPPGWEVELYRNNALVAYQQSRRDGRYEFDRIPLLFGLNIFRLVFYGPRGERRQEVETYNVGETLTPPGQLYYRIMGNDPKGLTRRGLGQVSYGVNRHLSAEASFSDVQLLDGDHLYTKVGLQAYFSRFFTRADIAKDQKGGNIISGGLQTRLGPVSISVVQSHLKDFESELFRPIYGTISDRTSLRLSGALDPRFIAPIPVTIDMTEDRLVDGGRVYQFSNLISALVSGLSVSNRLDGSVFSRTTSKIDSSVFGALLVSRYLRSFSVRGEVDYSVQPRSELTSIGLTTEMRPLPDYLLELQLVRAVAGRVTHYIASLSRDQGPFSFGVATDVASNGQVLLKFGVSAGLTRNPFTNRWGSQARPVAGRGAAAVNVFLDTNGNGVRDPGEKAVEGATFMINRSSEQIATDKNGKALLTNLPADQNVDLSIAPTSLEDPLWIPEKPGVRFVPRGGKALQIDFPVLVSGEITGTVYLDREGTKREAPGIEMQLVDAKGAVIKSTRTAYDGFYDLTNIVPGKYSLRAAPEQAARIGLTGSLSRPVAIAPTGTILDGLNFVFLAGPPRVQIAQVTPPPTLAAPPSAAPAAIGTPPVPPTPPPSPIPSELAAAQKVRLENERQARLQQEQLARADAERKAREDSERQARLEAENRQREEAARAAKLAAAAKERQAAERATVSSRRAQLERASQLSIEQRFRESVALFDQLAPFAPGEAAYRFDRAVALYELGRYAEAKEELRAALPAIRITPDVESYRVRIEGAIPWK
jgi:hypothetical protein